MIKQSTEDIEVYRSKNKEEKIICKESDKCYFTVLYYIIIVISEGVQIKIFVIINYICYISLLVS